MRIAFDEVKHVLEKKLIKHGCDEKKAEKVAYEMARNSLEGIYTHGINRFARLIRNIDEGIVRTDAEPEILNHYGALMNIEGHLGLGIINAWYCMEKAIALAEEHGVGMVALRNTNHWLRAATYGYQACEAGMAGICFTNTMPNMPTWGAVDSRIGNNPVVFAFPRKEGHLIVDMAMSQFSYGALELARLQGKEMPIDAGFNTEGKLTRKPDEVIDSKRILPTGYWKGAALSFMLDIFAGVISMGNTVSDIGCLPGDEHGVSQIFMAIDYKKIVPEQIGDDTIARAVNDLIQSEKDRNTERIIYTGQTTMETRADHLLHHIPVNEDVWGEILAL